MDGDRLLFALNNDVESTPKKRIRKVKRKRKIELKSKKKEVGVSSLILKINLIYWKKLRRSLQSTDRYR